MKKKLLSVLYCLGIMFFACKQDPKDQASPSSETVKTATIIATNYPLQYLTQRLTGEAVKVKLLAPQDIDPAQWVPSVENLLEMQQADLVVLNGASYEPWLNNSSLTDSKLVNTSSAFSEKYIQYQEKVSHTHGPEGEHSHTGTAFTLWLDMTLAQEQLSAIKDALSRTYPDLKDKIEDNYVALSADLQSLDEQLKLVAYKIKGTEVLFSHPVYQYFQEAYDVQGSSLHWEPGIEITNAMWHELDHELEHTKVQWMIWESEPLQASADQLKAKGIISVVFNPCANSPKDGDFISVMTTNIQALEALAKS